VNAAHAISYGPGFALQWFLFGIYNGDIKRAEGWSNILLYHLALRREERLARKAVDEALRIWGEYIVRANECHLDSDSSRVFIGPPSYPESGS